MDRTILRLVLIVSCAHALVHIYELTLPAVEQEIAREYRPESADAGKELTGLLSWVWRLPFGFGALLAGWLVDRFGSRRMLVIYLLGCSLCCLITWIAQPMALLFVAMALMGAFASVYHPAGLALISLSTSPVDRTRALGIHGILGSIGISSAPMLVDQAFGAGLSWRSCYALLSICGVALAMPVSMWARRSMPRDVAPSDSPKSTVDEVPFVWTSFLLLTLLASIQGLVYAGVLSFLPRYLESRPWASIVLFVGCIGQYLGARFARPGRLESLLTIVTFCNVPMLIAMAVADDRLRILAAAGFSVVHFMYQPIYNSLIAKYTPRGQRSQAYGFSFAMSFGIGSLGASYAGFSKDQLVLYGGLAATSFTAGLVGVVLWSHHHRDKV